MERDRRQAEAHDCWMKANNKEWERRTKNAEDTALANDYREQPPQATKNASGLYFWVKVYDQYLYPMLGLAKSKAMHAYQQGMRKFNVIFHIGVGRADIALAGRKCHITLSADDSFAFEFATTGAPVSIYEVGQVQEGTGLFAIDFVTVVADVKVNAGVLAHTARINTGKRENALPGPTSLINAGRQIQGLHEPRLHPAPTLMWGRTSTPYILMHSYDPTSSHIGPYARGTACRPKFLTPSINSEQGGLLESSRDIDYDLPFSISQNAAYAKQAMFPAPQSDWPRAAGVQRVTHPVHGTRIFGISIDASNSFVIFPVDAITVQGDSLAQSVSEQYVVRVAPTYPEWVWRNDEKARDLYQQNKDVDALIVDVPQYGWKFNHDGTKACAVMHERRDFLNDASFWAVNADENTPWTQTKFDDLCDWMGIENMGSVARPSSYGGSDRYMVAPGLVEATIAIEITGAGLHSFNATVEVAAVRAPEDCKAPIIHAGYPWISNLKCNELDIPLGSLVTITLEVYVRPGVVAAKDERVALWVVHNETQDVEIFSVLSDGRVTSATLANGAVVSLLAWDPQTFSFIWRFDAPHITGVKYPKGQFSPSRPAEQWITERGVWPVILGEPRDLILPETMSEDDQKVMQSIPHLDGRARLKEIVSPEMTFMHMNPPFDEWNTAAINNYRDYWAFDWHYGENAWYVYPVDPDYNYYTGAVYGQVRYKNDIENPEPILTAAGSAVRTFLNVCGIEHEFMMFCTAPKFGWHLYQYWMAELVQFHQWDTFYTHPNGTWAYYNDRMLYDRNGLPRYWDGTSWSAGVTANALSVYDAELVEHWIVDVVHFETRVNNAVQSKADTSFFDLYNTAVKAGADPELEQMQEGEDPDLGRRAKFYRDDAPSWDESRSSDRMLALRCEWHGKVGWLYEPVISNGAPALAMFGFGELNRPALSTLWFQNTAPNTNLKVHIFGMHGQVATADPSWWHMRFYDPVVIMSR